MRVSFWYSIKKNSLTAFSVHIWWTGTGSPGRSGQNDRSDYTDKSDPVREKACIWCMTCVTVCPTTAIKVEQSNMGFHQQAASTFQR